jgi:hypothetical protein
MLPGSISTKVNEKLSQFHYSGMSRFLYCFYIAIAAAAAICAASFTTKDNMFGTGHPRPSHRKEVAMHVVRQEERRLDSHTLTVDVPDAPHAALPPAPQAIRFDVVYTLPEYLAFLSDHLAAVLRQAAPAKPLQRRLVTLLCTLIGAPVFFIKKRRMPRCAFCIDAHGIERRSRAGTLVRSWADIRGVRRYRRGYLVLYDRGAMPIPFRCMDREQEAAFRRLASATARL